MSKRTHVWMLNMGGPDRPEAIQPFLQRLLGDPYVVPMPFRWLQAVFAWVISRLRAPRLLPVYEKLGGASPQLQMVEDQARALGRVLGKRYHCRPVLRYSDPTAAQAAEALDPGDQVVLLPLYPHACQATTTTSLIQARRVLEEARDVAVTEVVSYPVDEGYVEAVAETLREGLSRVPRGADYHVVFSAHGVPRSFIDKGDPYQREVLATVDAVVRRTRLGQPWHTSYQSRLGPTKWLEPSTTDKLAELGSEGVQSVVVVPVAFTSDHVETLIELDEELARVAQAAGIKHFVRAPVVGLRPTFIRALAEIVRRAEREATWDVPEDEIRDEARRRLEEQARAEAAEPERPDPASEAATTLVDPARPSAVGRPPGERRGSFLERMAAEADDIEEAETVLISAAHIDTCGEED